MVRFVYDTGLGRKIFHNVRLRGSWDEVGGHSEAEWTIAPMREFVGEDGALCYEATVEFPPTEVGKEFRWNVLVDGPSGLEVNGIAAERPDTDHTGCYRSFVLGDEPQSEQRYYLTNIRRLGAIKHWLPGRDEPGIRFAVWAPNAQAVEVVFGKREHGYIADDGTGIDEERPILTMKRDASGIWSINAHDDPALGRFADWVGTPYLYRITKEDGGVAYRTDLYSRLQMGLGELNPRGQPYLGSPDQLEGVVSCSVIVDTDLVTRELVPPLAQNPERIPERDFWEHEFNHANPVPHRIEDLVIYELHVGSLGFGNVRPGNFEDAVALLDYLVELGVNAVEILPVAEFNGTRTWGYGNSHHFAVTATRGGRDQFRHFVRECHRRGIAVIVDVVYNHFAHDGERAEWHYDSDREDHNIYYWYEGKPEDYVIPEGGYLDNVSTGYAPRYSEEMVRKLFISSAVAWVEGFHIDGFRVDQTTSIHSYNALHVDGRSMGQANVAGAKFLRELARTLRLVRPSTLLMCEDHSDWHLVTEPPEVGGLGYDATWYANFYHHLIGDTGKGPNYANLLWTAGMGEGELAMDYFAGALAASSRRTVVYHESHDEAGNSEGSKRTLVAAVAGSSNKPEGELRLIAEGRCRFAAGMTLLSAGTPMFLMGEEIGAAKDFTFSGFLRHREDLYGERRGEGRRLFAFYRDLIRLRLNHRTFTSRNIEVVHTHNANRVLAFRRWNGPEEYLVVATLSDRGFAEGYSFEAPSVHNGRWCEIFSSDDPRYGGQGVTNAGGPIEVAGGQVALKLPARGFVVLRHLP